MTLGASVMISEPTKVLNGKIKKVGKMIGGSPVDFKRRSTDVRITSDTLTEKMFSRQVSNWFGPGGFRDMRSYFRYRVLDYFNAEVNVKTDGTCCYEVSNEEMAINALFLDFVLRKKYYFTLNIFISEIERNTKVGNSLISMFNLLSNMTVDELNNQTPFLKRAQFYEILRCLRIDPKGRIGREIRSSYKNRDGSCSLIQLLIESFKTYFHDYRTNVNVNQPDDKYHIPISTKSQLGGRKMRQPSRKSKSLKRTGRRWIEFDRDGLVILKERAWIRAIKATFKTLLLRINNLHNTVERQADYIHQVIGIMRQFQEFGRWVINRLPSYIRRKSRLTKNINLIKKWVDIIKRKQALEQRKRRSSFTNENQRDFLERKATPDERVQPQLIGSDDRKLEIESADGWTQTDTQKECKASIEPAIPVEKSICRAEEAGNWTKGNGRVDNEKRVDEKTEPEGKNVNVDQSLQSRSTPPPSTMSIQVVDAIVQHNVDLQKEISEKNGKIEFYLRKTAELESTIEAIAKGTKEKKSAPSSVTLREVSTNTGETRTITIGVSTSTDKPTVEMNLFPSKKCNSMIRTLELCKREMNLLKLERTHLDEDRDLMIGSSVHRKSLNTLPKK